MAPRRHFGRRPRAATVVRRDRPQIRTVSTDGSQYHARAGNLARHGVTARRRVASVGNAHALDADAQPQAGSGGLSGSVASRAVRSLRLLGAAIGDMGLDYGACTNSASPLDGRVVFEHDGCDAFADAGAWHAPR
jgi:hypothetical protein